MQGMAKQVKGKYSFLSKENKFDVSKYQNIFCEAVIKNKNSEKEEKKDLNSIVYNTRNDFNAEHFCKMFYPKEEKYSHEWQLNIIKTCLLQNTFVNIPKGLGKKFIASIIIFNFKLWFNGKIFFFAPSKRLIKKQKTFFTQIFENLIDEVCEINEMQSNNKRKEFYNNRRIFFMSSDVFERDLKKMYFSPNDISLVIFDEALESKIKDSYFNIINLIENNLNQLSFINNNHKLEFFQNKHNIYGTNFNFNFIESEYITNTINSYRVICLSTFVGEDFEKIQNIIGKLKIKKIEFRMEKSLDIEEYLFKKNIELVEVDDSDKIKMILDFIFKIINKKLELLKKLKLIPISYSANYIGNHHLLKYHNQFKARKDIINKDKINEINGIFSVIFKLLHHKKVLITQGIEFFKDLMKNFENELVLKNLPYENSLNTHDRNPLYKFKYELFESKVFINLKNQLFPKKYKSRNDSNKTVSDGDYNKINVSSKEINPLIKEKSISLFNGFYHKLRKIENILFENINSFINGSRAVIFANCEKDVDEIYTYLDKNSIFSKNNIVLAVIRGINDKNEAYILNEFESGSTNILIVNLASEKQVEFKEVEFIILNEILTDDYIKIMQRYENTNHKKDGKIIILYSQSDKYKKNIRTLIRKKSIQKDLKFLKFQYEASNFKFYEPSKHILHIDPYIIEKREHFNLCHRITNKIDDNCLSETKDVFTTDAFSEDENNYLGRENECQYIKYNTKPLIDRKFVEKSQINNADFSEIGEVLKLKQKMKFIQKQKNQSLLLNKCYDHNIKRKDINFEGENKNASNEIVDNKSDHDLNRFLATEVKDMENKLYSGCFLNKNNSMINSNIKFQIFKKKSVDGKKYLTSKDISFGELPNFDDTTYKYNKIYSQTNINNESLDFKQPLDIKLNEDHIHKAFDKTKKSLEIPNNLHYKEIFSDIKSKNIINLSSENENRIFLKNQCSLNSFFNNKSVQNNILNYKKINNEKDKPKNSQNERKISSSLKNNCETSDLFSSSYSEPEIINSIKPHKFINNTDLENISDKTIEKIPFTQLIEMDEITTLRGEEHKIFEGETDMKNQNRLKIIPNIIIRNNNANDSIISSNIHNDENKFTNNESKKSQHFRTLNFDLSDLSITKGLINSDYTKYRENFLNKEEDGRCKNNNFQTSEIKNNNYIIQKSNNEKTKTENNKKYISNNKNKSNKENINSNIIVTTSKKIEINHNISNQKINFSGISDKSRVNNSDNNSNIKNQTSIKTFLVKNENISNYKWSENQCFATPKNKIDVRTYFNNSNNNIYKFCESEEILRTEKKAFIRKLPSSNFSNLKNNNVNLKDIISFPNNSNILKENNFNHDNNLNLNLKEINLNCIRNNNLIICVQEEINPQNPVNNSVTKKQFFNPLDKHLDHIVNQKEKEFVGLKRKHSDTVQNSRRDRNSESSICRIDNFFQVKKFCS